MTISDDDDEDFMDYINQDGTETAWRNKQKAARQLPLPTTPMPNQQSRGPLFPLKQYLQTIGPTGFVPGGQLPPPIPQPSLMEMLRPKAADLTEGIKHNMVTDSLVNLVKQFEGFRDKAYLPTPNDVPTIGYGRTTGVKMGDKIDEPTAHKHLKEELDTFQASLKPLIKVPLSDNQLAALTSLVYNVGTGAFKKSKALQYLNAGEFDKFKQAAFDPKIGFVKQKGKILKGLVNRRQKEQELFNS